MTCLLIQERIEAAIRGALSQQLRLKHKPEHESIQAICDVLVYTQIRHGVDVFLSRTDVRKIERAEEQKNFLISP